MLLIGNIPSKDDAEIKPQLSLYANSVYQDIWIDRGCPKNITVHDLNLDCYGDLKNKRYGIPGRNGIDGKSYDGVKLRGPLAKRHYTNSLLRIFDVKDSLKSRQDHSRQEPYRPHYQQNDFLEQPRRGFLRKRSPVVNVSPRNYHYQPEDFPPIQLRNRFQGKY